MTPAQTSATPRTLEGSLDFDIEGEDSLDATSQEIGETPQMNPEAEVGVHVFRLHQPDAHCFVSWESYRSILFDITNCLNLPRNSVTVLHYLRDPPVGI